MADTAVDASDAATVAEGAQARAPRGAALALRWAGLVAAAWALPLLTQLVHVDWLLPIVLLLGTASVLRAGHGLVDRLMFATILLCGAALAGGLLFSVWPWHLSPVPVAGSGLTALVVVALATGRRPQLPTRLLGSDAIILGTAAFAGALLYRPLFSRSLVGRLPLIAIAEDRSAHFNLFDTIHRIGGFTFMHPAQARVYIVPPTETVYPQGSHYLYALLDVFLRSTTDAGPSVAAFNRYFLFLTGGYAFLVLSVAWGARWVAGPALAGWRRALICTIAGTVAAVGALPALVVAGFDSEILGLAFLALAVAVTVRPAGGTRQYVLLVGAAVIALAYSYNPFMVLVGVAAVAALVVYRARLRADWLFVTVTAVVSGAIALLPTAVATLSGFDAGGQLQAGGSAIPLARSSVAGLVLVTLAVLVTRAGRRSPVWRVMVAQLVACSAVVGAFGLYQHHKLGNSGYYFEKELTGIFVIGLVGVGACGHFFKAARRSPASARLPRWRTDLVPGVAAMLVAGTFLGGVQWGLPNQARVSELGQTYIGRWSHAYITSATGKQAVKLADAGLLEDGVPTLVFYTNSAADNWRLSYLSAVLSRHAGQLGDTDYAILRGEGTVIAEVDGKKADPAKLREGIQTVEHAISISPLPLRIITSDNGLADEVRSYAAAHPGRVTSVVVLPSLS